MFDNDTIIPKEKEAAIKSDLQTLEQEASSIVVTNDDEMQSASRFLAQVKVRINRLKEIKDELVKPMKSAIKNADNWFKVQTDPFLNLEAKVKSAIAGYIVQKEKAAVAEAKQTQAIAERPKVKVNTEFGQVSSQKRWTWRITDESKVPREYLCIDNAKVSNAVRNGERSISGIEIFQDTQIRVS